MDIIRNFIFFEARNEGLNKILAQYHQYFAVQKAVHSTLQAVMVGDSRGGVFWHTQGERVIIVPGFNIYLWGSIIGALVIGIVDMIMPGREAL